MAVSTAATRGLIHDRIRSHTQTVQKSRASIGASIHAANAIKGAAQKRDRSSVGNDDDLRSVCAGRDGAFAGMSEAAIFVDHTYVTAKVTKEMSDLAAEFGIGFVDAPVSGGQAGAENGALSIMCGGDADTYSTIEPVMVAYASVSALIAP
ncbi:NAD(P)-binding domain-containing protein [Pacificibacter marinus]|uniref:NAD(P)-binding domain-containing protein n=1 Tax=Pacificibacter marinus TaxID=658057 RepID=UPI003F53B555